MGTLVVKIVLGILTVLAGILAGMNLNPALEALSVPPESPRAAWLKLTASVCFITGASLLLAAAILWTIDHELTLQEVAGWCGLAAFGAFAIVGGECERENRRTIAKPKLRAWDNGLD